MAKKRKKLTSASENIDPDVPTESELRLEAELRSAYEAERLIEEGGGLKDLAAMDAETLTLTDRGCDSVEMNRIGEEGDFEKFLEQMTKEQLLEIVKEALEKDKELEESVKKRFGPVLFKHSGGHDAVKLSEQKPKKLFSHGRSEAYAEKRYLDKGQDQILVLSRRDGRVAADVEKRHLVEAQDQLRVSSRRDGRVVANVEKRHLDEAQDQLRVSSRRDNKPEFAQRGHWKGKREELAMPEVGAFGTAGAAYLRSYGDEERRHLDEAQLQVSSRRDGRVVENAEKRHLDEAQDQLRVSSRRDNKPEFAQRGHRKWKREELTIGPEVGAFGTTGAAYLRSYVDEEQLHRPSWSDDYKTNYLPSGYWQGQISGQHWLGGSTYGARTFNLDFEQASDALISRQGAADYWLNSLPGAAFAAPMNQPGSLYHTMQGLEICRMDTGSKTVNTVSHTRYM